MLRNNYESEFRTAAVRIIRQLTSIKRENFVESKDCFKRNFIYSHLRASDRLLALHIQSALRQSGRLNLKRSNNQLAQHMHTPFFCLFGEQGPSFMMQQYIKRALHCHRKLRIFQQKKDWQLYLDCLFKMPKSHSVSFTSFNRKEKLAVEILTFQQCRCVSTLKLGQE